jgi:hypothetical protein
MHVLICYTYHKETHKEEKKCNKKNLHTNLPPFLTQQSKLLAKENFQKCFLQDFFITVFVYRKKKHAVLDDISPFRTDRNEKERPMYLPNRFSRKPKYQQFTFSNAQRDREI